VIELIDNLTSEQQDVILIDAATLRESWGIMPLRLSDDSAFSPEKRRDLTPEELSVLREVRMFWGPQNRVADVIFSDKEAALFVTARDGSVPLVVVLTNLGAWLKDGTMSLQEVRRHVMGPKAHGRPQLFVAFLSLLARIRGRIFGWDRL